MLDRLIRLVIDVRHRFKDHHINDYSATLAFFWFLAIFPTFVLLFAVMAWLGIDNALLIEQIEILIPGSSVRDMLSIVYDVSGNINAGLVSIGAIIAVWSASNGTARLVKLTVFAYGETEARSYVVRRLIGLLTLIAFSIGAVISWQMLSTGYSVYVDQFSMFGDTYGTIGIVILLQIWLYLTAATMLLGAEINAAWPDHMRRTRYKTHFP